MIVHVEGRVVDIHPLVGNWETLMGEGGLVRGLDLGIVGGERGWVVWLIVMKCFD